MSLIIYQGKSFPKTILASRTQFFAILWHLTLFFQCFFFFFFAHKLSYFVHLMTPSIREDGCYFLSGGKHKTQLSFDLLWWRSEMSWTRLRPPPSLHPPPRCSADLLLCWMLPPFIKGHPRMVITHLSWAFNIFQTLHSLSALHAFYLSTPMTREMVLLLSLLFRE